MLGREHLFIKYFIIHYIYAKNIQILKTRHDNRKQKIIFFKKLI